VSDQLHELEGLRTRFLDQLHATRLDLAGHEAVLAYWQLVERQAEGSGDLELLERSVRELARDRDRLSALEARVAHEDQGSGLLMAVLQVIHAMMEVLAQVARKLGRLRDQRRGQLAAILWLAGPGALANQRPDEKDEEKQKEEAQLQAALLAQRGPGQPAVQTPPEQQKKLER
jgi:hypothetical protein